MEETKPEENKYNLDVDIPEKVPNVLRYAAEKYEESVSELAAAHGDKQAGKIWGKIAKILEKASVSIDKELEK